MFESTTSRKGPSESLKSKRMHDVTTMPVWWKSGVVYEVYVRSFKDGNRDGIGDLPGIIEKLDYFTWLGVKAIWLTPVYPSPMRDFGYDISDYRGIHPLFGTMEDFKRLLDAVHERHMRLILDLVPNHTSDRHPWFIESRSSINNPKRDWYIWEDPGPDGSPPNNWLAAFGGSAWEWDSASGQYYMHSFLKEQPDLNWRNPEVREAIFETMRFWLDKGVDGFRIDVLWHLIKDRHLRDNPENPDYRANMASYEQLIPVYSTDQPEVHEIVRKMRRISDEYRDRVLIAEVYLPLHKLVSYYGQENDGAHLPFNFQLLFLPWVARDIALAIDAYEGALPAGGWPNWVLGNHDQSRVASRIGRAQARVAAMLLLTLRGTPTIYYGEELGLEDVLIPTAEIQDPMGVNMPDKQLSRDPQRTPMPWTAEIHGGFSPAKPWLRLGGNWQELCVSRQREDGDSILHLYRRLIALRRKAPALHSGSYIPMGANQQCLAYKRTFPGAASFLVVLNFSHKPCLFRVPDSRLRGRVAISTLPHHDGRQIEAELHLSGDEGVVVVLNEA